MVKEILLTQAAPIYTLEQPSGFTQLRILSATSVEGAFRSAEAPFIALRVKNDTEVFNLRMNLVPGSNQYHCFDVLETAAQVPKLANVSFDALEIAIPEHQYEEGFTVTMEVEVE